MSPGVVLDAGAVRRLSDRSARSLAVISALCDRGLWPARVPIAVVVEAVTGDRDADRHVEALLACCDVVTELDGTTARRAAWLRTAANRGTATDAVAVAMAEGGGTVLVHHRPTIEAMALFADGVFVERLG
ncbi:MAG: hypothetical protein R2755_14805 [Acidimicrobiales bacterium]